MNYQIKLFHWPERGDHIIMVVRGFVEIRGFKQMFRKVGEMTELLSDCKVLIDLVDANYRLDPAAIQTFVSESLPINGPRTARSPWSRRRRSSSTIKSCCWPRLFREEVTRLPPFTTQSPR